MSEWHDSVVAIFDIDGTLRTEPDSWLHLHQHLGILDHGEEFFRRWSAGEISYRQLAALDASLWQGIDRALMLQALDGNPVRPGACELVAWFRARGIRCIGISTGLSLFNDVTQQELGLDEVISNQLQFDDDVCTGAIVVNVEETTKADVLQDVCRRLDRNSTESAVVFGDGNADLPMFELARVSVAVFPRSADVASRADLVVEAECLEGICEGVEQRLLGTFL